MNKFLIWGTGNLAEKFIQNGYYGKILGFIDTYKFNTFYMGYPVYSVYDFPYNYDYIIVANSYVSEIYDLCLKLNLDMSKIIFLYGEKERKGCIDNHVLKEILQDKNYTLYCAEFGFFNQSFIEDDLCQYKRLNKRTSFEIKEQYIWPIIGDKYALAGMMENYFWQDLWAAKLIIKSGIKKHFDIGSRVDGFIAHLLSAGLDITMIDVREFPQKVDGLYTIVDDATMLKQIEDKSIESMSALCSLEHFGLGRYGDPIDPEACFKCFNNIKRN